MSKNQQQSTDGSANKPLSNKEKRRARILKEARNLITRDGVNHLRVRELAERSGVATATLYNLFGGKDGLIMEALQEDYLERFRYAPTPDAQPSPAELLLQLIDVSSKDAKGSPENTEAVMLYYFGQSEDSHLRAVTHDAVKSFFAAIINEIDQRGDLVDWADIDAVADDLVSSTYAVLFKWIQGHLSKRQLKSRLLQVAALPLIAISNKKTREEFEALLRKKP